MNHLRLARLLALIAGLLDFSTSLGLALLPTKILPLMLAPIPGDEALIYLRFVGAFVAAVGASYLWALLRGDVARLRSVFEFTPTLSFRHRSLRRDRHHPRLACARLDQCPWPILR